MPNLSDLEDQFREARESYEQDRTDEAHDQYREAKLAFTQARVEQRKSEELDPDHPRGQTLAAVSNEENGE